MASGVSATELKNDSLDCRKHRFCTKKGCVCMFVYEWEVVDIKLLKCQGSDILSPELKIDNDQDGLLLILHSDCDTKKIEAHVKFCQLNNPFQKYPPLIKAPEGFSFGPGPLEEKCVETEKCLIPLCQITSVRLEFLDFNWKVLEYLVFTPENSKRYFIWEPKEDISKYVEGDTLKLRLKVTVQYRDTCLDSESSILKKSEHLLNLCKDLENLNLGNHFPDLGIKICGKQFMVHQCIVMPQFKFLSQLLSEMKNISSEIKNENTIDHSVDSMKLISIPNVEPEIFEVILQYIYTGKLTIDSKIDYFNLFDFAQKYQLFELCRNLKPIEMLVQSQVQKTFEKFYWPVTEISLKIAEKFVFHESPEYKTSDGAVWHMVIYFLSKDSIYLSLKNVTGENVGPRTYFRLIVYKPDGTIHEEREFNYTFRKSKTVNLSPSPPSPNSTKPVVDPAASKPGFLDQGSRFQISSELLFDDTLCIGCEITVCGSMQVSKTKLPDAKELPDYNFKMWLKNLQRLSDCGEYSDITLTVGDVDFKVHKAILSARSPVFDTMFRTNMSEKINSCVKIEDLSCSTLKSMLWYMYTGSLDAWTIDEAPELYRAADQYQLLPLKEEVSKFIIGNLDPEHACEVLLLANLYEEEKMMGLAKDIICRNASLSLLSEQGQELMINHPQLAQEVFNRLSVAYCALPPQEIIEESQLKLSEVNNTKTTFGFKSSD